MLLLVYLKYSDYSQFYSKNREVFEEIRKFIKNWIVDENQKQSNEQFLNEIKVLSQCKN